MRMMLLGVLLFLIACLLPRIIYCQGMAVKAIIDTNAQAQVFAPGSVSSQYDEWATSFSADGKTVYFSRGGNYWTVCFAKNRNGVWQRPEVAAFSGVWRDTDPFVSPDGRRLFFVSNRPLEGMAQDKPSTNYHLWFVDNVRGDEWGKPHHMEGRVNLDSSSDYGPSASAKGTLCWCSRDREGNKGMQGYYSLWMGDHYGDPQRLVIPGAESVQDPFIAPDESYLVFLNGIDIYIAMRSGNGWAAAQKLGPQVNNGDYNSSPYVSRDGRTLYYSSGRVKGFYQRNYRGQALNYDALEKELNSCFNGSGNILMIPFHVPVAGS